MSARSLPGNRAIAGKPGTPVQLVLVLCWLALFFCLILPAWGAAPAGEDKSINGEPASPQTTGPVITDSAIPQELGTATLFWPTFLAFAGGKFNSDWGRVGAGGNFLSLTSQAEFYFGVAPRTEVNVVVPYQHNWAWDVCPPAPGGQRRADFGGLGDVSVTGKYLLIKEQGNIPAVSGIFTVTFPTGCHRHLNPGNLGIDQLGRGAFAFTPGLNFYKYIPPVILYGNLWYTLYTSATVAGVRTYYPDRITLNLAMEYPLRRPFVFLFEFVSYVDGFRLVGHRAKQKPQALMSILPAMEFVVSKKWSCIAGVLVDILGKNAKFAYTPNFTFLYNF